MFNRKLEDTVKFWCIKSLTICGFPRRAFFEINARQQYCNYYPYLYTDDLLRENEEFAKCLYYRHKTAQKLFSLFNYDFVSSAIYIALHKFSFLLLFILFITAFVYKFNTISLIIMLIFILFFSYMFLFIGKTYLYGIYKVYSNIICIIEATYICKKLENTEALVDNLIFNSIIRRIKNLSKLVYIHGKVNKDEHGYYRAMSMDIYNKVDWLNRPINTTLEDLKNYFKQIKYYWIIGQMGEIKVENTLLSKQKLNWIKMSDFIEKSFKLTERLLSLLERVKKLIITKK